MSLEFRKYLTVLLLLGLACGLVLRASFYNDIPTDTVDINTFPLTIGPWNATEIPVTEHVREVLGTDEVLTRIYKNGQEGTVMLAIIYSDNNRDSFHPPELCYIGAGGQLRDQHTEAVTVSPHETVLTNKLVMDQGQEVITAWYWFMVNDRFITNYYVQQVYLLLEAIRGRPLKGAMVRVSVHGTAQNLQDNAISFMGEITPILKKFFKT
ncbi:MAG: EpsI family protein [Candidatus Omnitrophica bacterium]|nr:EpsI family protein [Candidatus Omnitrophota bacterium]